MKPNFNEKNARLVLSIVPILLVSYAELSSGQNNDSVVYYEIHKDVNGMMSDASKKMARTLIGRADTNGKVTLWITLNYPFQTTIEQMTDKEIKKQQKAVEREFKKLLKPLVKKGAISYPAGELVVTANGCRVVATAAGVKALVSTEKVLHMAEVPTQT